MRRTCGLLAAALLASSLAAHAEPITISNAGYWLETVGSNTIGTAGGGSPTGRLTTLFVATTTPPANTTPPAPSTTASATIGGGTTVAPIQDATGLWVRRWSFPDATQLQPLTVTFTNDGDTATFTGRDLTGLAAMPLVQNLAIDATGQPLGPLITWDLPAGAGDIDAVQLVFYNDDTNVEVARLTLAASATSYDIIGPLALGANLVINVRLIDLFDDTAPFVTAGNILRQSRAYINYSVPTSVPEPGTLALLGLGLAGLAAIRRRRSK